MADDERLVEAVLEDWASSYDDWVGAGLTALTDPSADLIWADSPDAVRRVAAACGGVAPDDLRSFLGTLLSGVQHSMLATVDGASASAELGRVRLVGPDGKAFPEGLHELYLAHLFDTGRAD